MYWTCWIWFQYACALAWLGSAIAFLSVAFQVADFQCVSLYGASEASACRKKNLSDEIGHCVSANGILRYSSEGL